MTEPKPSVTAQIATPGLRRPVEFVKGSGAPALPAFATVAEVADRAVDIKEEFTAMIGDRAEVEGRAVDDSTSHIAELATVPRPAEMEDTTIDPSIEIEKTNLGETILRKFGTGFDPTAEPARAEEAVELPPEKLVEQIAPKLIEVAAPEGSDRRLLKMRLHPAELGSLEIELEREEGGSLTARIHTESAAAQHILVEGLDQLRDALQNSGWTINELQVDSGLDSAESGNSDGRGPDQQPARGSEIQKSAVSTLTPQDTTGPADGLVSLRA